MVIFQRKLGYTVAAETAGEQLTLCACAVLHCFLKKLGLSLNADRKDSVITIALFKKHKDRSARADVLIPEKSSETSSRLPVL